MDQNYTDALKLFYNSDATCPSCGKNTIIRSESTEDGSKSYIMKCSNCGWKMNISLPVYVNIFKELLSKEREKIIIISQLTSSNLKDKKVEYKNVKNSIADLQKIIDTSSSNQKKFTNETLLLQTDMTKKFIERKNLFNSIKEPHKITKDIREKFIEIIRDEKTISEKRLGEIVKSLASKIDKKDAENYFRWLIASSDYVILSESLKSLYNKSKDDIEKSIEVPLNYMIKPPKVSESTTREKIKKDDKPKPQIKTIKIAKNSITDTPITSSNTSKNIIISPEQLNPPKKIIRIKKKNGGYFTLPIPTKTPIE